MLSVRYTLVADGPSDRALMRIIDWVIREAVPGLDLQLAPRFADRESKPGLLAEKIASALVSFPCDLLFVHRDAERIEHTDRYSEVQQALEHAGANVRGVAVVPVRMTEAWLLFDATAIARAADRGPSTPLALPPVSRLDDLPDPKGHLHLCLREVSGKTGRRLQRFTRDMGARVQRVAEYIETFAPLRVLPAFQQFEADTTSAVRRLAPQGQSL